uniref:RING-type E3 ubiquitin transferase n=1 Tax=Neolamprologus brichardi TaxID=32507 RepID=A0A3Q4HLE1_NEOBR
MDAMEKQESGHTAVPSVENEAESTREERSGALDQHDLDTCPVCHLSFHSKEPKLLPCLHTFCGRCLPLPSRNLDVTEPSVSQINVIRCPVCRQECMAADVVDNMFVKESFEAPSSTVERAVQLCMTCDDNTEAAGFCVECVEYLCTTCVEAHQRVKFTKDHMIRQKSEVSQDVCVVSSQRPMFCHIHKQEPLKLFCETCDLLTCRDCQLTKHKDHSYQFLEDAYKNHKEHMEHMTHQLQEKKKLIKEVSDSINSGLLLVEQNRTSVRDEIKKSVSSLILAINKKGKIVLDQLEAVTKDHESLLRKQQEDIGYLSQHLDHVIDFIKWATAKNGGTALLYCKRLILFQIENLLQAKCSASFVPQSTIRFQCRASYWASNVDLGKRLTNDVIHSSPHSFAPGAPHSTLAQLQMQVDKLNPQAHWQPQPPPPPCTWHQSIQLQQTVPGPLQRVSPSHSLPPQPDHRFTRPLPNHVSSTRSILSPGFSPQVTVCFFVSIFWKAPEIHQASGAVGSAAKKRQRSSPRPIIVIKDELDDDSSYVHPKQRASLPDSTDDQPPKNSQVGEQQQVEQNKTQLEDSNEASCAVCQTTGQLLCCQKCHKAFHLTCHVPALLKSPSREWFCTFCCDLLMPEMEYVCKPEAKTIKKETDFEGAFSPVDKRVSAFFFFLNDLLPFILTIKGPVSFSTVKNRLEAEQSMCYQNPAEFVLDIRLIFGNCVACSESNTELAVTCMRFKELFEDYLKLIYPDQTFPEIKPEMIQTASPDCQDSQLQSLDNIFPLAKRQRTYSDSQDAPSCHSGEEGIGLKLQFS